ARRERPRKRRGPPAARSSPRRGSFSRQQRRTPRLGRLAPALRAHERAKEKPMSVTKFVCAGLLSSFGSVALACDLPPLVAVPAKGDAGADTAQLQTDVAAYVEAMRAFTACVQAELVAVGGDSAPTVVKAVLVN